VAEIRPLAAERYHVRFTTSAAVIDKLRQAQDLLGHAVRSGEVGEVIERALDALLDQLQRRKYAATDRPRESQRIVLDERHIPAAVKRAVWLRDGGRCAFIGKHGHRCPARRRLEYHHVVPFEVGGLATVDNIELRCQAHNLHEADVYFAASREGRASLPTSLPVPAGTPALSVAQPARATPAPGGAMTARLM
jgi:5-methylcytosine-specific restriction endonuclease McrA